ncbi:MAG TPA: hypothetical protein PKE63_04480 [Lacibacter sp.]|nr:hypothetical protein [Lacibacter sp.]HMO88141.1 hypothetical protein [Lacibacter sp.]HMP86508.1 hypothetical protein [Lacibacter sp.]
MKQLLLLAATGFLLQTGTSQQLSKEGTHDISKKANKGYLYEPKINEEKKELEMTYVTKASGKKAKFETYRFDLDFTFKGMEESEVPLEKIKGYKGDEYTLNAVTVESNLLGTLVLRRKIITRKWNWFWGGYESKIKLAEKLKPKTEEGDKMVYIAHTQQDELETVLIIAGAKGAVREDPWRQYKEFHVLRYDRDLNRVADEVIKFETPQYLVGINSMGTDEGEGDAAEDAEETTGQDDILMLFAPAGGAMFKKIADPAATNYTFVRVGYDGKIKERISVPSKAPVFNGDMFLVSGSDVYIIGATGGGDKSYYNESFADAQPNSVGRSLQSDNFKAKGFQIVKISGGKVAYATITTLAEFEAKAKTPPSQKKKPEYTGKRFRVQDMKLAPNGDFFVAGQKFNKNKNGTFYEDIIMMHFNNGGALKAAYGVRREENSKGSSGMPNTQLLEFSKDGSKLYWMIMEMAGLRAEKELGTSKFKALVYPSVSKIDINSAAIGEFVQFGQGKTDYYVNNKYPLLPIGKNELVFLGENKNGKTLWFAKMPLE